MSATEIDLMEFARAAEYVTMCGMQAYSPAALVLICKWLGDMLDAAGAGDVATVGRLARKVSRKVKVEQQLRAEHLTWSPPIPRREPDDDWRCYVEYVAGKFLGAANPSSS
jgi:hypothetical protein